MTDAICATSLASPMRSRRAVSMSRNVAGISRAGELGAAALDQNLGQLLDEERDAVGAFDDLVDRRLRQRLVARQVRDQFARFVLSAGDRG